MTRSVQRLCLVGAALVAASGTAACTHARPRTAAAALPEVVWPEAPDRPRVRLALLAPDPGQAAPHRSFWRRLLYSVIGLDEAEQEPPRPLQRPFGVAMGPSSDLFVVDPDMRTVTRVGPEREFAPVTCRGREWAAPMAVALDPGGALLVADAGAGEVVRVAADGRCSILGEGELERPTGVAVSPGRIFVADPPRHVVTVLDAASGAVLARLGTRGEGDGQLSVPTAVAVAPDGSILVVDALNFRVARFGADGRWLGSFGAPGDDGGAFARPKGIATGADGRIYVSDAQRDVVLVFLADGSFDYAIGASGAAPGQFAHPAGLAVGGGRLLVADSHNARIQMFDVLGGGRS
jgi:DNA-binding beta-propeller fold protein YncE